MNLKVTFGALRAFSRCLPRPAPPQRVIGTYKPFLQVQPPSATIRRFNTTSKRREGQPAASSKPLTDRSSTPASEPRPGHPEYQITFTCTPCGTRSSHRVSKQGYHYGSTLITCPECRNRHIISDHLNIFGNKSLTIEDLMKDKGMLVKKGTLSEDGDVEFWEDGTTTKHTKKGQEGSDP